MKKILFVLVIFIPYAISAQQLPDNGLNRVRIIEVNKIQQAEIKPVDVEIKPKKDRFYYWYAANIIHATQGGFSGRLLNGSYNEYYPDKNLKEQGAFKSGLKHGAWKSWNEDGTLNQITTWKNGIQQPDVKVPFWKKLNIFKRREKQSLPPPAKKVS